MTGEAVLPALVRCAPRLGALVGLGCSSFLVCLVADFFKLSSESFGRRMGLSGSIGGGDNAPANLGVVPSGLGVHLVPLPVVGRKIPWDNGVCG
jgi:hypothetical protein